MGRAHCATRIAPKPAPADCTAVVRPPPLCVAVPSSTADPHAIPPHPPEGTAPPPPLLGPARADMNCLRASSPPTTSGSAPPPPPPPHACVVVGGCWPWYLGRSGALPLQTPRGLRTTSNTNAAQALGHGGGGGGGLPNPPPLRPPPPGLWDTDACARPALFRTKQECKAKVEERSSSVTCHGRLSLQ